MPETYGEDDLFPDVRPTLTRLREAGLWVGVVAASDEWGVHKPDPGFFARSVAAARCAADEVLYVGDRLDNDIRPAGAAGLRTALIRRGPWALLQQGDPDVLAVPTFRIDSLDELPGLIARFGATPH